MNKEGLILIYLYISSESIKNSKKDTSIINDYCMFWNIKYIKKEDKNRMMN